MVIQLNSSVIYYEHYGEGQPLILLHGNGEDHQIFDPLGEQLSSGFEIFAPDSRGHGLSARQREYHYQDMADDICNLILALEINHPIVLGFSDGGITALLLAIGHQDLLSGIIICGANTNPKGLTFLSRQKIKNAYKKSKDPLLQMMLQEPDITEAQLETIKIPTLVFAGEKDIVKKTDTEKIASHIPGAKLQILPGETHESYVVGSTRLARRIRNFLPTVDL